MESTLIFNPTSFCFTFKGKEYKLGKTKYMILKYLYDNRNKPVTTDELINNIWDKRKIELNGYYFINRSMEVHLVTIKKIINSVEFRIENIHSFGKILITNNTNIEFARKKCIIDNSDYKYGSKTINLKTIEEKPPKYLIVTVKEYVNIIHKNLIENGTKIANS